ncbi:cap-specific mRNA (nucleoside-2'-O-)-methyltransferase 2 [Lingula anatina]|uniref:Cap-specific mRNA (nucleoside-2'-O-)-methyltransferase 2 n=1 Tax=Lingula anatina TaxID=7574 RepID=A0A1S3JAV8_LINAN|nr:cap-specific mRNA (nucleoside-2'-O-)-methyltransferase 2 [Lingula anatina]XP_013407331.1 cap-specific mRNA (nucleoside-2'-O-)-methyltransferase 2 [Lingula anatina]|eukprot:XP_013407323.1 cap-specific mRNA (nucleoside-2'-O-)-methyltransferase 2 [Lingula anatina]
MGRKKKRKRYSSGMGCQVTYCDYLTKEKADEENIAAHREILKEIFCKKFSYEKPHDAPWVLPDNCGSDKTLTLKTWETFMNLKKELNDTKSLLSDKDIGTWHRHTQQANPAGKVVSSIKEMFSPELCTQAWCKFYEILSHFHLIPDEDDTFRTLHLCEAPGAFVCSLNHYLKSKKATTCWEWEANTLNPYYEGSAVSSMIGDDRLLYHTLEHWNFGKNGTGDIMDLENHVFLRGEYNKNTVKLVTADGSIDCQDNPGEQEQVVAHLKMCECLLALSALGKGGHFIQKMFTMFESNTICLMYLLNCSFEEVHLYKPATSKPGNSEVYVVCVGFYGRETVHGHIKCKTSNPVFPPSSIPQTFIDQHIKGCEMFKKWQTDTIHRNIKLLTASPEEKEILNEQQNVAVTMFIEKCHLQAIREEEKIVVPKKRPHKMAHFASCHPGQRHLEGSYAHRQWQQKLQWKERVLAWKEHDLEHVDDMWLESSSGDPEMKLITTFGRQVDKIRSSKFCDIKLLEELATLQQTDCHQVLTLRNEDWSGVTSLLSDTFQNKCIALIDTGSFSEHCCHRKWLENETTNPSHNQTTRLAVHGEIMKQDVLPVHFLDFTKEENKTEIKKFFIDQVFCMMKEIRPGGTALVQLHTTLLRFTVGLLYILHKLFSKVTIKNYTSSTDVAPQRYYLCTGYQEQEEMNSQNLMQHLLAIQQILSDNMSDPNDISHQSKDVWEVIALPSLFEKDFYRCIYQSNNVFMKQEINYLIHLNKLYYKTSHSSGGVS